MIPIRRPSKLVATGLALIASGCIALVAAAPARGSQQTAPTQGQGNPLQLDEGRRLYLESCSSCHGPQGEGARLSGGVAAPSLRGVGAASVDFYIATGRMPLADTNSQAVRKPPAFNDAQRAALVAYVTSLAPGGPPIPVVDLKGASLSAGAELFLTNCAACHNAAGVGGALSYGAFAPSLHPPTPVQIAEAQRIGPGNMPVFGPETLSDKQVDDVVRYVEYLQHPDDAGGAGLGHFGPIPEGFVGLLFGLGSLILFVAWVGTRA
ncbi:MAG TPA: c-type cytochrome [Acidimicrobiales bacterium]|nr:c-type cytochrome [Acidimicrobiales bacterium]